MEGGGGQLPMPPPPPSPITGFVTKWLLLDTGRPGGYPDVTFMQNKINKKRMLSKKFMFKKLGLNSLIFHISLQI